MSTFYSMLLDLSRLSVPNHVFERLKERNNCPELVSHLEGFSEEERNKILLEMTLNAEDLKDKELCSELKKKTKIRRDQDAYVREDENYFYIVKQRCTAKIIKVEWLFGISPKKDFVPLKVKIGEYLRAKL